MMKKDPLTAMIEKKAKVSKFENKIIRKYDSDKSGTLDKQEMQALLSEFDDVPLEDVQQAMQELDLSGDGIIQKDELVPLAIHILMTKRSHRKGSLAPTSAPDPTPTPELTPDPYELLVQQQEIISELKESMRRQEQEMKEIKELLKKLVERS